MKKVAIACILIVLPLALSHADSEAATSHRETILSIAADIEKLKPDYPQLEAFSRTTRPILCDCRSHTDSRRTKRNT